MRKHRKWIIISLCVLIIGILIYYSYFIFNFGKGIKEAEQQKLPNQINEKENENQTKQQEAPPPWEGTERVNILLLGIDSRGGAFEEPRSDTIMLVSIDPLTEKANLFSILRDTYVEIPGFGMNRMNAAYAFGRSELAMQTISLLLDLPIHYYVSIDFEGFIHLVDAIGGIHFEVEKDMKYTDPTDLPEYNIDLKQGYQHLDGNKALQYVRFRYDRLSDFTRTERQRNLLQTVADKMLSFSSLIRLPSTLDKIEPYIKTNVTLRQMWALGILGNKVNNNEIMSTQLPPNSLLREENIQGSEVITVDSLDLQAFVQEQLNLMNFEEVISSSQP